MDAVKTIREGSTLWTVRADLAEPFERLLGERLGGGAAREGVPVIKENLVRTVYRVPFPTDHGDEIILKDYRIRRWDQRLRYLLLPSKAAAEWRAMRRLRERGFPTAIPVAYGEDRRGRSLRGCSFASVAIPGAVSFPERFREAVARGNGGGDGADGGGGSGGGDGGRRGEGGGAQAPDGAALLRSLAGLVATLHEKGVFHRDLHVGNVLVSGDDLHLIDLHRASFPSTLSRFMRLADISKLCHSMSFFAGEPELRALVWHYGEASEGSAVTESEMRAILAQVRLIERRRIRSRSLRCVKTSSAFRRAVTAGEALYHRRTWKEETLREALAEHRRIVAAADADGTIDRGFAVGGEGGSSGSDVLLHASPRSRVTRVETPQGPLAVKEYIHAGAGRRLGNALRGSPARRAYIAGRGLEELGIPTPRVVGLLEERSLGVAWRSFLFTEHVESEPLERHFGRFNEEGRRDDLAAERRAFLDAFAAAVRRIHDADVYQPDMAGQNFLVEMRDGAPVFHLVDLDRVRLGRENDRAQRLRNLSQVGYMPGTLTRADRLHFLQSYGRGEPELVERETVRLLAEMIDQKGVDQARRLERITRKRAGDAR